MRRIIYNIVEKDEDKALISQVYHKVMLAAIVVGIIPLMFRSHNWIFDLIDVVITILFTIDYILRWITADYRSGRKGMTAFFIYPFTLVAIVDLLTILPIISYVNNSFRVLRTWRLLRILRIAKVFKYYEPLQIVMEVFRKKASVLLTVVGFAIFYIFVTALFMFNVELAANPENGQMFFEDFFDALYWSTCTLTTVGYGDIYPLSDIGRVVSMISALVGIAIIALPSGIITAGYMEETNERKMKKADSKKSEEITENSTL